MSDPIQYLHPAPVLPGPGSLAPVVLTEDKARALLAHTGDNLRPFRKPHGVALAREMIDGRWRWDSPEPFYTVDSNGVVMNGQHRLWAFVAYARQHPGVRHTVWAGQDFDPSTAVVLDQGRLRSASDLIPHDTPYRSVVAGTARILILIHRRSWTRTGSGHILARPLIASYARALLPDLVAGARSVQPLNTRTVTFSSVGAAVLPALRPDSLPFIARIIDEDCQEPVPTATRMALARVRPSVGRNDIPFIDFAILHFGYEAWLSRKEIRHRWLRERTTAESIDRWWPAVREQYGRICDSIFGPRPADSPYPEVPAEG